MALRVDGKVDPSATFRRPAVRDLVHLVYSGAAGRRMSEHQLVELLSTARASNASLGATVPTRATSA